MARSIYMDRTFKKKKTALFLFVLNKNNVVLSPNYSDLQSF